MPLIKSKSKEAFKKNIWKEIASGKKPSQAVAIAYSVKKESSKSDKKSDKGKEKKIEKKEYK